MRIHGKKFKLSLIKIAPISFILMLVEKFELLLGFFHSCLQTGITLFFFFAHSFLARLLILIKKGGLLQLKFGGVGVGVNIYLWAR